MRPDIRVTPDVRELDRDLDKSQIQNQSTLTSASLRNVIHKVFLILGWVAILYMILLPFQRLFGQ
jgi:hypothetical protein